MAQLAYKKLFEGIEPTNLKETNWQEYMNVVETEQNYKIVIGSRMLFPPAISPSDVNALLSHF